MVPATTGELVFLSEGHRRNRNRPDDTLSAPQTGHNGNCTGLKSKLSSICLEMRPMAVNTAKKNVRSRTLRRSFEAETRLRRLPNSHSPSQAVSDRSLFLIDFRAYPLKKSTVYPELRQHARHFHLVFLKQLRRVKILLHFEMYYFMYTGFTPATTSYNIKHSKSLTDPFQ